MKAKIISSVFLISILFIDALFTSCDLKQDEVERIIEDGVEVVLNHIEPYKISGVPSNLILEKEFTIDLESEDLAKLGMIDPGSCDVDSEGSIYFWQQRTSGNFIFKFDRNGNFTTSLGRKGQGPGEIQFPTSLAINNRDELVIIDTGSRKLVILDKNGNHIKEFKLRSKIYAVFPLQNGRYLIYKSLAIPEAIDAQIISYILCDSELNEIKEINRVIRPHLDKLEKINGIGESGLFRISNDRIYFGKAEEGYEIWVYDLDGNLVRKIRKEYKLVPVTEETKRIYMRRWDKLPREIREKVYFPRHMPPYQGSFTDDKGRLFVMTFEKGEKSKEYVYDVFNPEGVFVDRIKLDNFGEYGFSVGPLQIMVKGNSIYRYREKESGYKEFIVFKMKWKNEI